MYDFAGMRIECGADASVRLPGAIGLAGSALTLDQAVRNLVAWGLAAPAQAVALASARPRALLARAGGAQAIGQNPGVVLWDAALQPRVLD